MAWETDRSDEQSSSLGRAVRSSVADSGPAEEAIDSRQPRVRPDRTSAGIVSRPHRPYVQAAEGGRVEGISLPPAGSRSHADRLV